MVEWKEIGARLDWFRDGHRVKYPTVNRRAWSRAILVPRRPQLLLPRRDRAVRPAVDAWHKPSLVSRYGRRYAAMERSGLQWHDGDEKPTERRGESAAPETSFV